MLDLRRRGEPDLIDELHVNEALLITRLPAR